MTAKNFLRKGLATMAILILIGWIGHYFFIVDGEIDWLRLALIYGIPVGIPHMFIVITGKWDLSGLVGMAAFCIIIGGLFGFVIAIWLAFRSLWYLIGFPVSRAVRLLRRLN